MVTNPVYAAKNNNHTDPRYGTHTRYIYGLWNMEYSTTPEIKIEDIIDLEIGEELRELVVDEILNLLNNLLNLLL